jgi:hypothetical protein
MFPTGRSQGLAHEMIQALLRWARHGRPRRSTAVDARLHAEYSCAIIAVDVRQGRERWVTQVGPADVEPHMTLGASLAEPAAIRLNPLCTIGRGRGEWKVENGNRLPVASTRTKGDDLVAPVQLDARSS